jgi:3'-phosphoadenosine 5'-phosphosulfate sulfotransferase (PAPS reductase)/FAD synthetase
MKIIVSFSGGKDSQACLIQACKEFGAKNIEAVFCDTGWEHHLTYEHVVKITTELGVKLVTIKSEIGGFENLCKRMKWFPDTQNRMCTVHLKIMPMIDYILKQDDDLVIIQGIRAAESKERSKMPCSANYFKEYLDSEKEKKHLYRKKDVLKWCQCHTATVERPMFGISAQEIIDYILENGQEPNPLYKQGFSRVGCFPCIYARLSEIKAMRHELAYVVRAVKLEEEVNRLRSEGPKSYASILMKGKIPARYCKKYGNGIPAFEDVIAYVSREDAQLDLFDTEKEISCMSVYHGLCE